MTSSHAMWHGGSCHKGFGSLASAEESLLYRGCCCLVPLQWQKFTKSPHGSTQADVKKPHSIPKSELITKINYLHPVAKFCTHFSAKSPICITAQQVIKITVLNVNNARRSWRHGLEPPNPTLKRARAPPEGEPLQAGTRMNSPITVGTHHFL